MKKYILSLFVFAFIFSFFSIDVNFINASSLTEQVKFKIGSRGDSVRAFQQILTDAGFPVKIDGKYGPITAGAAKKYYRVCLPMSDGNNIMMKYRFCQPQTQSSVVVSGISGSQSLEVNQPGTWTVTASDVNGGTLSYSVLWGDEVYATPMISPLNGSLIQQSATFTHSYAQGGVYTPIFTVTNSNGQSAKAGLSVNVGGITNTNNLHVNTASAIVKVGETTSLQALFNNCPTNAECSVGPQPVQVKWTSSNSNVATVTYKYPCPVNAQCFVATDYLTAVVTGVSEGTATITATYSKDGKLITATAIVTVKNNQTAKISSLSPVASVVGNQVIITGSDFATTGNRIKFGDSNSENNPSYSLNSYDGKTLVFTIPSTYYVACFYSIPHCDMVTRMILPGVYDVYVINDSGTSNAVKFTVNP